MPVTQPRVLFVCTGNRCRSPVAAALFARRLVRLGLPGVADSAGLMDGGALSPREVVAAAQEAGLDLSGHHSRRITSEDIQAADLVIGMAREHVREAVLLEPPAFPKTFSLRELVRRASVTGRRPPEVGLGEWLQELHVGRRHADLLGASSDDDVRDPMGGPPAGYRSMVSELDELVASLTTLGWTPA